MVMENCYLELPPCIPPCPSIVPVLQWGIVQRPNQPEPMLWPLAWEVVVVEDPEDDAVEGLRTTVHFGASLPWQVS